MNVLVYDVMAAQTMYEAYAVTSLCYGVVCHDIVWLRQCMPHVMTMLVPYAAAIMICLRRALWLKAQDCFKIHTKGKPPVLSHPALTKPNKQ